MGSTREPVAVHVTMRLVDDRVIATTAGARRIAARVLHAQGWGLRLLAFCISDTHIHAVLACSLAEAGRFARDAECALRWRLGIPVPFERCRLRPIATQAHLYNAFWYVLRQARRHGIDVDPWHDGSTLVDLLGLRVLDTQVRETVAVLLPRVQRAQLVEVFEVGDFFYAKPRLETLAEAAAAAAGIDELAGRAPDCDAARRAAAHACRGIAPDEVGRLLGLTGRAVRRLWSRPVDAALVRAVGFQMRLRGAGMNLPDDLRDTDVLVSAGGTDLRGFVSKGGGSVRTWVENTREIEAWSDA